MYKKWSSGHWRLMAACLQCSSRITYLNECLDDNGMPAPLGEALYTDHSLPPKCYITMALASLDLLRTHTEK